MKDYYQILGVPKNASKEDIKKAFRKIAHEHHPDKQGGNTEKFKEANEAYSVLSDDKKRQQYDTYGSAGPGGFGGAGGFNAQDFGGFDFSGFAGGQGFQEFDLGDIFGDIFGGGRREQTPRGRDISVDIDLTFEESIFGTDRTILLNKTSKCDHCSGSGGEPGTSVETCKTCHGKGKVQESRRSLIGSFTTVTTCSTCHGKGSIPKEKCKKCRGAGVLNKEEEIPLKVPAGIENGQMIQMTGKGEAVAGGNSGDLYIKIHVKRHSGYTKEGSNLITSLNVKLTTALLGGECTLNTLEGPLTIKIPEGITHNEILRVKGKGVPIDKNKRGDILVKINIELPGKISRDARKHIEELKKEGL